MKQINEVADVCIQDHVRHTASISWRGALSTMLLGYPVELFLAPVDLYLSVFYELAKVYRVRKRHFFIDKNNGPHEMKHTQEYCTVLCYKSNIIFCIAIREIDTEILAEKNIYSGQTDPDWHFFFFFQLGAPPALCHVVDARDGGRERAANALGEVADLIVRGLAAVGHLEHVPGNDLQLLLRHERIEIGLGLLQELEGEEDAAKSGEIVSK